MIRHFFNSRHAGKPTPWWTWGVAVAGVVAIIWLSALGPNARCGGEAAAHAAQPVDFAQAEEVVISRCSMCHAETPAWEGWRRRPRASGWRRRRTSRAMPDEIRMQAVLSNAMPPGNITMITPEERQVLAAWTAGAK